MLWSLSLSPLAAHADCAWSRAPVKFVLWVSLGVGGPFTSPANAPPTVSIATAVATTSSRLIVQPLFFFSDQPKDTHDAWKHQGLAVSITLVLVTRPDVAEARSRWQASRQMLNLKH
jgi:hypothetical protein